jgi:hypothetical protein
MEREVLVHTNCFKYQETHDGVSKNSKKNKKIIGNSLDI